MPLFLVTERLYLVATPLEIMERRLHEDAFEADIAIDAQRLHVRFPPEWPGEGIVTFEGAIRQMRADASHEPLGGTIVERETTEAVGQMSLRRHAGQKGIVELGYGINPSCWNRGYATEMARALVSWADQRADVDRIVSECLIDNVGSIRVLEKTGFHRTGERDDDEGRLITWQYGPVLA